MDYYDERDSNPELEGEVKIDFGNSEILKYYAGASIFVTGGAGFLGSLIVEKIARSCPDFGKIYLLLRPKRGLTPSERLDLIFQDEVFDLLKKKNPTFISRIHVMEGDLGEPMCGLSMENQRILREEVDLVFHVAACLRMIEPLMTAYTMNIRATKDLLDLATTMRRLKGFVYVSTAYSNCFRPVINETWYEPNYRWKDIQDLTQVGTDYELQCLSPKLLGPWVNTYAFTKAIAEDTVKEYIGKIPVAIARPSIVIGCNAEPKKNWINNIYGVTGVAAGAATGILRVFYGDPEKVADLIPADIVVNTIIAIPWQIWRQFKTKEYVESPIYNVVSSPKARTTWQEYNTWGRNAVVDSKVTTRKALGECFVTMIKYKWLFCLLACFFHIGQGLVFDTYLRLKGKQPKLIQVYIKIMQFSLQLAFFTEREWKYEQPNVDKLLSEMNEDDKSIFPFDMTNFNWPAYHLSNVRAIYRYVIKAYEDVENPTLAKKRYFMIVNWRRRLCLVAELFILYLVVKLSGRAALTLYAYS